jgi:hypothetical protein
MEEEKRNRAARSLERVVRVLVLLVFVERHTHLQINA